MRKYRPVDPKADFPALEERVLAFWRDASIFEKSLALREGAPEWVFYEGPPTANGKPGTHHVEARVFKDVYLRFRSMTGHSVPRKAGWDCHGLPVELEVEKQIGTKTKRDIEAFGVAEFNRLCRESVKRYVKDFERLTDRIGFWLNMDEAYWTMDASYVQSVWWALKRLHDLGLLVQDDKSVPYCPRCGTGLSDHEVALGYQTDVDPSVFVNFPVVDGPERLAGASMVGWTTTPWTLTSNLGLAVAAAEPYVRARIGTDEVIVAEARLDELRRVGGGEAVKILDHFPGSTIVGARYSPPFENIHTDNTHRVVAADFVVMNEGTGIVHIAPGFGADDLDLGRREGWPVYRPVDDAGRFTDDVPEFLRGRFVKDADPDIIDDLRSRGLLLLAEEYEHTYPHCWRCTTPLLYMARTSWYVRTTARKQQLLDANEATTWYPDHIKHGRYGDWLENNVDWALSRERYWGTPLPIWTCASRHETAIGSLAELSALAGHDVTGVDPHRPAIDDVTLDCPECGHEARRVPEVIDTWFDSGAMPFAQWGFMGDDSPAAGTFRKRFPADFIVEAIDQTRGWFYSLMAESTLLFDENAYRNVVCLGHIVDGEGRKMSKSLGNVVDPWEVIERFGADAMRWFFLASGSPWSPRRVSMEAFDEIVRQLLLTVWHTHAFFVTYANIDGPSLDAAPPAKERLPLDRWVLSRLHNTAADVRGDLDAFDATAAGRRLMAFVDDLSNWYVRRSRRRFWDPARGGLGQSADATGAAADQAKLAAYATLHDCLVMLSQLLAPFTPFLSEELYRNLVAEGEDSAPESVHLTDFPTADSRLIDAALEEAMATARTVVSLGRTVRSDTKVRVRQPLAGAVIHVPGDSGRLGPLLRLIAEELNVKDVRFAETTEELAGWRAKPNFRMLGPKLGAGVKEVAEALATDDGSIAATLAAGQPATVPLGDGEVTLLPGDVELTREIRAGWGLASDGPVTVALELELDQALRREGVAREVVHHVQNLRKSAGLDVTDRIVLGIVATGETAAAVASHRDWIAAEVLATELREEPVDAVAASVEVDIDGSQVRMTLRTA